MAKLLCRTHPNSEFKRRESARGVYYSHMIDPKGDRFDRNNYHNIDPKNLTAETLAEERDDSVNQDTDWNAIAEGKVRSLFIQAFIQKEGLRDLDEGELIVFDRLVKLAMTGK